MILGLILSRRLTDLTFTAATAASVAAAVYITSGWDMSERLRKVTIILYLYITISLSVRAAVLAYKETRVLSGSLVPAMSYVAK